MSNLGYLLDTNVVSETRRKRPEQRVIDFVRSLVPETLFISVLTIGELRKGAVARGRRRATEGERLHAWIDEVENAFGSRVLPVDLPIARMWGELSADRPRAVVDTILAATALVHDLALVTRNTRDVGDAGVPIINPWLEGTGHG